MEYSADFVAEYVIKYCNEINTSISNLKLQKLLYLIQHKLLNESESYILEDFIALPYGPVIKNIYDKYSAFGAMSIYIYTIMEKKYDISDSDINLIERVLEKYSRYDAWDLVNLSHKKDNSWYKIKNEVGMGELIPKNMIKEDII